MSLELDQIYAIFGNPLEKQLADMRNQLSRSTFQMNVGDTKLDNGSLGINSRNLIKIVNNHYHIKNHLTAGTLNIFPAFEPDYDKCKFWLNTDHYGFKLVDDALIKAVNPVFPPVDPEVPNVRPPKFPIGQDITMWGDPRLESGFDRGYGDPTISKKQQALHFNRVGSPTLFKDYIQVKDQAATEPVKTMRILDTAAGATFIFRIKSDSFATNFGFSQRVWNKIDQDANTHAVSFIVLTDGKVNFQVKNAGTDFAVQDASFTPSLNTEYEYALVWNPAGATTPDKMKIYRDGVLKTNTNVTAASYGNTVTDHDTYIGKLGGLGDGGYFQGYIILCKLFIGYQATAAELLDHFTNKLTIADILYGQVAVPDWNVPHV